MEDETKTPPKNTPRRRTPASRRAAAAEHSRTLRQRRRESGLPEGRTIDGEIVEFFVGIALRQPDPARRKAYFDTLSRSVAAAIAMSEEALLPLTAAVRSRIDYRCKRIDARGATKAKKAQPPVTGET